MDFGIRHVPLNNQTPVCVMDSLIRSGLVIGTEHIYLVTVPNTTWGHLMHYKLTISNYHADDGPQIISYTHTCTVVGAVSSGQASGIVVIEKRMRFPVNPVIVPVTYIHLQCICMIY